MKSRPLHQRIERRLRRVWLVGRKGCVQTWRARGGRVRPRLHVFVVGAQRSGTNMVMGLLERSLDTAVFHERDPRAFDHYLMREPAVIDRLAANAPAPVFVLKALCEMDRLPELLERHPPARVLWVVRHHADAVNSSLQSFTQVAAKVSDLVADPEAHGWMGRGMSAETLRRVRTLYRPDLSAASRVALFWYWRNRLLFDLGLHGDPRLQIIRYEALVGHPEKAVADLFGGLSLRVPKGVSDMLHSESVRHRAQPEISPSIDQACQDLLAMIERYQQQDVPETLSPLIHSATSSALGSSSITRNQST